MGIISFGEGKFNELFRHFQWGIGVVREPIHAFLDADARPKVEWFAPLDKGRFLADPFGLMRDGRVRVLCEEFDYRTRKGTIVYLEFPIPPGMPQPQPVIRGPFHMSYPYLFEYHGNVYCVPETHHAREVSLYKAEEFPLRWNRAATLIKGIGGLDITIFEHSDRWWLACTDFDRGPETDLLVWHAPSPLGPWTPHPRNPVKRDIGSARSAGTPFRHKGNLYRPAQDCSKRYGGRIVLNRITRLTPTEFQEEPAAVVEPYSEGPYPDGIHTLSAAGDYTLVDGYRLTFIKSAFRNAVRRDYQGYRASVGAFIHKG